MAGDADIVEMQELLDTPFEFQSLLDRYAAEDAVTAAQSTVLQTLDPGIANAVQLTVVKNFTKVVVDPAYEKLAKIVDDDIVETMDNPSIPGPGEEMRMLDQLDGQGGTADTVSALFDRWKTERQETFIPLRGPVSSAFRSNVSQEVIYAFLHTHMCANLI